MLAKAREKKPILEGFVAMTAPLFVMVICSITILVLMTTGALQSGLQSTNMCVWAFEKGLQSKIGNYVVIISLIFLVLHLC